MLYFFFKIMIDTYYNRVKGVIKRLNPLNEQDKHINVFFRLSSFIPANIVVCYGLLTTKTIYGQMFWQIINQTYNVGFNYANKSNNKVSNNDLIKTYTFAVASSSIVSASVSNLFQNVFSKKYSHLTHTFMRGFIPFTAIFLSSTLNLYYVRKNDIDHGIPVYDNNNDEIGYSKIAAKNSFIETASCRTAFRFLSCMAPPLIEYKLLEFLHANQYLKIHPNLWMATRLSIITSCLYIAMPLSFTILPNKREIDGQDLEDKFKNDRKVFYNRGM